MNYQNSFQGRVESFLYAVTNYDCYNNELKIAVDYLDCNKKDIVVNLGGGGININKFLNEDITYIPLEFSTEFSEKCSIPLVKYDNLPLENDSVNKILILALLHHFSDEERDVLYKEIYRVLKKDGKFILSDVIKGSRQDIWLNKIVDKFNRFGHKGIFFTKEDSILLERNCFKVDMRKIKYYWEFKDDKEMCNFMKNLFYLDISEHFLLETLYNTFIIIKEDNIVKLEWELIYFICTKN